MKTVTRSAAVTALIGIVLCASLFMTGAISIELCKATLLVATGLWFVAASMGSGREAVPGADSEVGI